MEVEHHCVAFTATGTRCTAWGGGERRMCATHTRSHANGLPERRENQCAHYSGQRRCPHDRLPNIEHALCETHNTRRAEIAQRRDAERAQAQADRRRRNEIIDELYTEFRMNVAAWTWRDVVDELIRRRGQEPERITREIAFLVGLRYATRMFNITVDDYANYVRWAVGGRVGDPPPLHVALQPMPPPPGGARPGNELARIAADRQNVHTAVVSRQTNENLDRILSVDTTSIGHRSVERIGSMWLLRSFSRMHDKFVVLDDMHKWYIKTMCRAEGDRLYKRTLDGVFALILTTPDIEMRRELVKRLYEECFEAVGLCCDGHISRLCNVFVGFDERFKPEISVNEQLQTKIAMIAAMEIPREAKVTQATAVLDELHVAPADRVAWLEALE